MKGLPVTRLRSQNRDLTPLYVALAIGAATYLIGCHLARAAGAAAGTQPAPGIDWPTVIALGLGALASVRVIVDALLAFFKAEAPLTKTLIDDHIRDSLQSAHDKLDKLAGTVNGLVDATKPPGGIRVLPGTGTAAMLAVLLLCAMAAPTLTGCTASQARQTASAGAVAALDCEGVHIDAQLAIDLRLTADAYVKRWITGTGAASTDAIAADLAPIKSDAVKCAIVGALAAATTLIASPAPVAGTAVSALSVPGPDPAVVRDRFRLAARTSGWTPVKITGGDVL